MSLDFHLVQLQEVAVFDINITHNLAPMARAAGIYRHLWRPDEAGADQAWELIEPLKKGLKLLESNPDKFKKLDAPNGWGTYDDFVQFVRECLQACVNSPDAYIGVYR